MNYVALIGRLTKAPEVRETPNTNKKIAKFTLAVNRDGKNADFIVCKAFEKTAEIIEKYTDKGSQIAVEGRIQTGSYEKDGKKVYTTDIIVNKVELLGKKEEVKPDASDNQIDFAELDDAIPF